MFQCSQQLAAVLVPGFKSIPQHLLHFLFFPFLQFQCICEQFQFQSPFLAFFVVLFVFDGGEEQAFGEFGIGEVFGALAGVGVDAGGFGAAGVLAAFFHFGLFFGDGGERVGVGNQISAHLF